MNDLNLKISTILNRFDCISLEGLEKLNLLDRFDSKFAFRLDSLPEFLVKLIPHYNILQVDSQRQFHYSNLYFDTPDFYLYKHHLTGRRNRYKIRFREYACTGRSFFEIKSKDNRRKTIKHRLEVDHIHQELSDKELSFLNEHVNNPPEVLYPKLTIEYKRITLVHKVNNEKVTLDSRLYFKNTVLDYNLEDIVIAEIKQNKVNNTGEFRKLMHEDHIRQLRISKYCTGSILTNPGLRYNRYKPKILYLSKLQDFDNE
jgi:hypothetical protein